MFINDIHANVSSTIRLFADDCLIYNTIRSTKDEDYLQDDLDKLVQWANIWGLRFNPENHMRITRRRNPNPTNFTIMGVQLEEERDIKALGVQLQHDLRWNKHVEHATSKAIRVLGFIRRNLLLLFSIDQGKTLLNIGKTQFRIGSSCMGPLHQEKHRQFRKDPKTGLPDFFSNSYDKDTSITAILRDLNWTSLQERRKCHRLTCLYKMTKVHLDVRYENYISPNRAGTEEGTISTAVCEYRPFCKPLLQQNRSGME